MGIFIQNIKPRPPRASGVHMYKICINSNLIAFFDHKREDGLATCLRKAAEAVDKAGGWED